MPRSHFLLRNHSLMHVVSHFSVSVESCANLPHRHTDPPPHAQQQDDRLGLEWVPSQRVFFFIQNVSPDSVAGWTDC